MAMTEEAATKAGHDYLTFAVSSMVGSIVKVQMKSGQVYQGVLHGCDVSKEGQAGVALSMAYKLDAQDANPFDQPLATPSKHVVPKIYFKGCDVAQLSAVGVDLRYRAPPPASGGSGMDAFTDRGISGGSGKLHERELTKWEPEEGDLGGLDDLGPSSGGWSADDMFRVNEQVHGIRSEFDESAYTTTIDRNNPEYKRRRQEAERIAREIEGRKPKGRPALDMSEEELHSAVLSESKPGSYVAPHKRQQPAAPKQDQPSTGRQVNLKEFHERFVLDTSSSDGQAAETKPAAPVKDSKEEAPDGKETKEKEKPKSKLKFNVGAAEFKPSFAAPAAAPAGPPVPTQMVSMPVPMGMPHRMMMAAPAPQFFPGAQPYMVPVQQIQMQMQAMQHMPPGAYAQYQRPPGPQGQ